jgi:hypothetical protein
MQKSALRNSGSSMARANNLRTHYGLSKMTKAILILILIKSLFLPRIFSQISQAMQKFNVF